MVPTRPSHFLNIVTGDDAQMVLDDFPFITTTFIMPFANIIQLGNNTGMEAHVGVYMDDTIGGSSLFGGHWDCRKR